jgi:methyl-accepting chemotaxis protein
MSTVHRTSIRSTFLIIQTLVALLLVFLAVQGVLLWRVCHQGTVATKALEQEGIPSLTLVASLKENLDLYRLHSYEMMFAQEKDRAAKAAEADALNRENLVLLGKLKALYPSGQGQQMVGAVESDLSAYTGAMEQLRAKIDKDFEGAMHTLDQEIPARVARLNESVSKFATYCDGLANESVGQTVGSFGTIKATALGFGTAGVGFAAIVVVLVTLNSGHIRRRLAGLVEKLADGSGRVDDSGRSVSAASQSLAEGASQQAASLEETSASLEEMASMTKRNADNAQKANELARQAREAADHGVSDMQRMAAAMNDIKASSDDIAKIIKTIDEIAFQTNILALNAAVEAARAGEAGMGFAVVADEVRSLAQRSAQAAKETAAKIEGAIAKTSLGVDINAKVAQALDAILSRVRQVDELVAEVASASREQSQGITQVNTAVGQMDRVTQHNAANAEESAAAAQELNSQSELLKQAVADLLHLVDGSIRAAATPQARASEPAFSSVSLRAAVPANGSQTARRGKAPSPVHPDDDAVASAAENGGTRF